MKKRFFWFTYIVSSLSAFSIWLMMIIQSSAAFSWSDFIQIVIPVFILTLLLTIIFTHVMWQPIDQFMESQPEYTDIEKDSLVKILQRIMQRYDSALFENQNRLSILLSLMNHLQEGVVIINQDEKIDFHNSAAASILHFSIQPSEKWLYEVIRSTELMDRIRKTIHERKQFLGEAKLIIPQETTVLYTIVPLTKQANQSGWKALLLIQDITSIRKLEKVRTDFIGNVSHELKSPLTAMLGYSELLASAEKIDPENQNQEELISILKPYQPEEMKMSEVTISLSKR
jgi:two-component system phosphate regulon sensor histidine kinase PhoR